MYRKYAEALDFWASKRFKKGGEPVIRSQDGTSIDVTLCMNRDSVHQCCSL